MSSAAIAACGLGLARNDAARRFPRAEDERGLREVRAQIVDTLQNGQWEREWQILPVSELSPAELAYYVERGLMTPSFARSSGSCRGFAVYGDGEASLEINGTDHIQLLGFRSGDQLDLLWSLLSTLDDQLETGVAYAFDPRWGYLTARPQRAGSGMRVYATLHVPALMLTGRLAGSAVELVTQGYALAPLWGGAGGIVQVSNVGRQGKPEGEILQQMLDICHDISERERSVRKMLLQENIVQVRDHIGRALGVAQHAWSVTFPEAVNLVSAAQVGLELEMVEVPGLPAGGAFDLMRRLQPGHIMLEGMQVKTGCLENPEIDQVRAQILREVFAGARVRA